MNCETFFSYVISVFSRIEIPYMVVGGFAAIFYGEPRLTIDVDIVADIRLVHVPAFVQAFPIPDYYYCTLAKIKIRDKK